MTQGKSKDWGFVDSAGKRMKAEDVTNAGHYWGRRDRDIRGVKALQYNSQNRRSHGQGQTHGAEDILGEGKG